MDGVEFIVGKLRAEMSRRGALGLDGLNRRFKIMDDDGSRSIDLDEYRKAMREMGMGLNDQESIALFEHFDENGDGSISYEEFVAGILQDPKLSRPRRSASLDSQGPTALPRHRSSSATAGLAFSTAFATMLSSLSKAQLQDVIAELHSNKSTIASTSPQDVRRPQRPLEQSDQRQERNQKQEQRQQNAYSGDFSQNQEEQQQGEQQQGENQYSGDFQLPDPADPPDPPNPPDPQNPPDPSDPPNLDHNYISSSSRVTSASTDNQSDNHNHSDENNSISALTASAVKKQTKKKKLLHHLDWNENYQAAITTGNWPVLKELVQEFTHLAIRHAQILVEEIGLDPSMRTITPILAGGVAGGEKFLVHGLLFKFALDVGDIYGGDDENAKTSAGHELKGLNAFMEASGAFDPQKYYHVEAFDVSSNNAEPLFFPLQCLIDYRGYRLIASTLLPIENQKSLVYGCADVNRSFSVKNGVNCNDLPASKTLTRIGKIMNLKVSKSGH